MKKRRETSSGYVFAVLSATALALASVGVGAYLLIASISQSFDTERTEGTVVALEEQVSEGSTGFIPVVEYEVAGRAHRCRGNVAFSPAMHHIGQKVAVLYDIHRPGLGYLDSFKDRWLSGIVFTAAGLLFLTALVLARPFSGRPEK